VRFARRTDYMAHTAPEHVIQQIREDLRAALRLRDELKRPIRHFALDPARPLGKPRHFVLFDLEAPKNVNGLQVRLKRLGLYDERIIGKTLELAGKVWHLKDKIAKVAKARKLPLNVDDHVNASKALTIVADLSNANKHGENRNRSGLRPHIELVIFDTSQNGKVELFYDGATKEKELLVEKRQPIPFTVELRVNNGAVFGDAVQIIDDALTDWLPLVEQLKLLWPDNREVRHLREQLKLPPL
jgi:hypothetical protein